MIEQLNQAQLTAPETIYLQHNDSGYMDEPFPTDHEGTSWCDDQVFNCDVRYVRADIAEGKRAELQARIAELERVAACAAVPDGWALVPVKASKAMIYACAEAAREYMREHGGNSPSVMWRAMVAAAPSPQLRDAEQAGMGVGS